MVQRVLFLHWKREEIEARLDAQSTGSNSGSILLRSLDRALGLTDALATGWRDPRCPGKTSPASRERRWQRAFGQTFG